MGIFTRRSILAGAPIAATAIATSVASEVPSSKTREMVADDREYFIRPDASEGNDGRSNTIGGAFKRWQQFMDAVTQLETNLKTIKAAIMPGEYKDQLVLKHVTGGG